MLPGTGKESFKTPARRIIGGIRIYMDASPTPTDIIPYDGDLVSFEITKTAPQGKFFGFVVGQKIKVEVRGKVELPKGTKIDAYIATKETADSPVYTTFFYVETCEYSETKKQTIIEAFDIFQKASDLTIGEVAVTYPVTMTTYAGLIASAIGCKAVVDFTDTDFSVDKINVNGTETLFNMLISIAEVTGTVCYNKNDEIIFKRLNTTTVDVIKPDNYFTLNTKDAIKLTKVSFGTQLGNNVSTGTDGFEQVIWDNPFIELYPEQDKWLEALAKIVLNQSRIPYDMRFRGNPYYETCDCLTLVGTDAVEYPVYFFNEVWRYGGGFKSTNKWDGTDSGNIKSNPSSLGEMLRKTEAIVDKVNNQIDLVASEVKNNTSQISNLQIRTNGIDAAVQETQKDLNNNVGSINGAIGELTKKVETKMNSEEVGIEIQKQLANGIDKVTTKTGFTFNEEGLRVSKTGTEISTLITEDGMRITKGTEEMLVANNKGVDATNLHAKTYLIIGNNSRIEDIGSTRTGVFWIGG